MANVRVAVRVRPLIEREVKKNAKIVVDVNGDMISVVNLKVPENSEADSRERVKTFTFDYCYWHADAQDSDSRNSTQEIIFQDLGVDMLDAMFDGYNACMLAYGPSGSGKTFTMMGHEGETGLVPRICKTLFSKINEVIEEKVTFCIDVSYLEIYNERVQDLLQTTTNKKKQKILKVREHPKLGPYVQDLTRHKVTDFQTVLALVDRGNDNRSIAATENHQRSSRSHAIFTINCTQARLDAELPSEMISKIHLIDLAGSERASNAFNKVRLKESSNINKSLVTLGNVISALADRSLSSWSLDSLGSSFSINSSTGESVATTPLCSPRRLRHSFVPYRDSVLTWLLKDSLGGNSKTIMITTVSPASSSYSETINTLRYAQRTKCIVNRPVVNEEPNVKLIRQLRAEIARLRKLLLSARVDDMLSSTIDENSISEILNQNENKAKALTRSWFAKWHYALNFVEDLSAESFSDDAAPCADNLLLPHFIVLDNHILSMGIHIYYLKEGRTMINKIDEAHNIVKDYCHLDFDGRKVTLSPLQQDGCQINGQTISDPVQLCQADIIKLGNNYTLRFNHPSEVQKLHKDWPDVNLLGSLTSNFDGTSSAFPNSHCFYNAEPFTSVMELLPPADCAEINENNGSSCHPLVSPSGLNSHRNKTNPKHPIIENSEHAMEDLLNVRNAVLPGSLNFVHDSGAVIPLPTSNGMTNVAVQKATCTYDSLGYSVVNETTSQVFKSSTTKSMNFDTSNVVERRRSERTCVNNPVSSQTLPPTSSPGIQCLLNSSIHHDSSLSSANDLTPNRSIQPEKCLTMEHVESCLDNSIRVVEIPKMQIAVNGLRGLHGDHFYHDNHQRCCISHQCKLHPNLSKNGLLSMTELASATSRDALATGSISSCCDGGCKLQQKCRQSENWTPFQRSVMQIQDADSFSSVLSEGSEEISLSSSFGSHADELLASKHLQVDLGAIQPLNNEQQVQTKISDIKSLPYKFTNTSNCEKDLLLQLRNLLKSNNLRIVVKKKLADPKFKKQKCINRSTLNPSFKLNCNNRGWGKTIRRNKVVCVKRTNVKHLNPQKCWNTSSKLRTALVRAYLKNALSKPLMLNPVNTKNVSVNPVHSKLKDDASACYNSSELCKIIHSSHKGEIIFNSDLMNDIKNFINLTKDITNSQHITRMLGKDQLCTANLIAKGSDQMIDTVKILNIIKNVNCDSKSGCLSAEQTFPNTATNAKDNNLANIVCETASCLITDENKRTNVDNVLSSDLAVSEQAIINSSNEINDFSNVIVDEKTTTKLENSKKQYSIHDNDNNGDNLNDTLSGELKRTLSFCFNKAPNPSANVKELAHVIVTPECSTVVNEICVKNRVADTSSASLPFSQSIDFKPQSTPVSSSVLLPSFKSPEIVVEDSSTSVLHEIPCVTANFHDSLSVNFTSDESSPVSNCSNLQLADSFKTQNFNLLGVTHPDTELKRTLSNTDIQQALQAEGSEGATVDPSFCPSFNHPPKVRTNSWPEPSQLSLEQLDNEIQDLQDGLKVDLVNEVLTNIGNQLNSESNRNSCEPFDDSSLKSESHEQFSDSLEENDDKSTSWHWSNNFNRNAEGQQLENSSGKEVGMMSAAAAGRRSSIKLVRQRARVSLSIDGEHSHEETASSYSDDSLDESKTKNQLRDSSPGKKGKPLSPLHWSNEITSEIKDIENRKFHVTGDNVVQTETSKAKNSVGLVADDVSASYSDDFESDEDYTDDNNAKDLEDGSTSDEEIFYIPADPANPNWSLYYVSSDNEIKKKLSQDNFKRDYCSSDNSEQLVATAVASSKTVCENADCAKGESQACRQVSNELLSDDGFFEVDDIGNDGSKKIEKVTLTKLHSSRPFSAMPARDIDEWENEDFSISSSTNNISNEDVFAVDAFSYCPASSVDVFIDYRMIPAQERRRLYTIPELSSEYSSTPSEGILGSNSEAESLHAPDDPIAADNLLDDSLVERQVQTAVEDEVFAPQSHEGSKLNDLVSENAIQVVNRENIISSEVDNENADVATNQENADNNENGVDCQELWKLYKRFSEESDEEPDGNNDKEKPQDVNDNINANGFETCQQDVNNLLQNLEIIPAENPDDSFKTMENSECELTKKDISTNGDQETFSNDKTDQNILQDFENHCKGENSRLHDNNLKCLDSNIIDMVKSVNDDAEVIDKFTFIEAACPEIQGQCKEISFTHEIDIGCVMEDDKINNHIDPTIREHVVENNKVNGENVFIDLLTCDVLNELQTARGCEQSSEVIESKGVIDFNTPCSIPLNEALNDCVVVDALGSANIINDVSLGNSAIIATTSMLDDSVLEPQEDEQSLFLNDKDDHNLISFLSCDSDYETYCDSTATTFELVSNNSEISKHNQFYDSDRNRIESQTLQLLHPNVHIAVKTEKFTDNLLLSHHDLQHHAIDSCASETIDNSKNKFENIKRPLNSERVSMAVEICCRENDVSNDPKQQSCVVSEVDNLTLTPPTQTEKTIDDKAEMPSVEGDTHLFCSKNDEFMLNSSLIGQLLQDEIGIFEKHLNFEINSDKVQAHSNFETVAWDETVPFVASEFMAVSDDGIKDLSLGFHPSVANDSLDQPACNEDHYKSAIGCMSSKTGEEVESFHLAENQVESSCHDEQWNFESWLSHLPYTDDQNGLEDVDDLLENVACLLSEQTDADEDKFSFTKEDAAVIAALGTSFHSDVFKDKEGSETELEDKDKFDAVCTTAEVNAVTCVRSLQTSNSLSRGTSPSFSWVDQQFIRERSITPDSLENFQQSEQERLTSWQSNRNTGQQSLFTIRTSPAPCKQPLNVSPVIEDAWGASSDSITFVFMGPNLSQTGKSSSDPSAVLSYFEHYDDPGVLMLRSASLDCINRRPKCFGMLPYTLNTRASSMESMVPEDLMGVVERGRIHEIGSDETSKEQPIVTYQQLKSMPSKAYSQSSVIDEKLPKKAKKSVSWGDLSGCGLTVEENIGQHSIAPAPSLLKPIIKKSELNVPVIFPNDNEEKDKTENKEYTDNDVEEDLKNSALYSRIQKKCQLVVGQTSTPPPPPTFKLQLPNHVKARMNRSKSEAILNLDFTNVEKSFDSTDNNNTENKTASSESQFKNVTTIQLPPLLTPFSSAVEQLLSSKEASSIAAKAVALQDKSLNGNMKDLSAFLMETSNFFQQLSHLCDQNGFNVNGTTRRHVSVSTCSDAATQTDEVQKTSIATNTMGNAETETQSACILTSMDDGQLFDYFKPVLNRKPPLVGGESIFNLQRCPSSDFPDITSPFNLLQTEERRPFSTSLSSIPRAESDSVSGSPPSSTSVGRAVQVNTLLPRTSYKRSWLRREACLRKELEILSKEKESVLCQLENCFGSGGGGDAQPSSPESPDSPLYLFTYHERLQNACARIAGKLEKHARLGASENLEKPLVSNSSSSLPCSDGSSLSISSSDYVPLRQDKVVPSNPWLSSAYTRSCLSQSSEGSLSSLNTCGSEPLRLRPRDYRVQLVNFRRNLIDATRSTSHSSLTKAKRKKTAVSPSPSLPEQNGVDDNSSAEDIQALLHECRVARAKAQREIELAQQQLTAQRSAMRNLETVLRHQT